MGSLMREGQRTDRTLGKPVRAVAASSPPSHVIPRCGGVQWLPVQVMSQINMV